MIIMLKRPYDIDMYKKNLIKKLKKFKNVILFLYNIFEYSFMKDYYIEYDYIFNKLDSIIYFDYQSRLFKDYNLPHTWYEDYDDNKYKLCKQYYLNNNINKIEEYIIN